MTRFYIAIYDPLFDEAFQCELSAEEAYKARAAGIEVHAEPIPVLPIESRFRSVRHLGWDKQDE